MAFLYFLTTIVVVLWGAYLLGASHGKTLWEVSSRDSCSSPHASAPYYGFFCALISGIVFSLSFLGLYFFGFGYITLNLASALLPVAFCIFWGKKFLTAKFPVRPLTERFVLLVLFLASSLAVLTTVGIVFSVSFETLRFFSEVSPFEFLFGLHWSPHLAMRPDQVGASGSFGAVPLFLGTLMIVTIALCVAGPIGLFCAIYFSEYATPRFRAFAKPLLEILAGVPTVVFGFFAAVVVAPFFRDIGQNLGFEVSAQSSLAAGFVMGVMVIPFISSLVDDAICAVPQALRDASYAMGATRSETITRVVLPAALPGIVSAFILAISRAIGETMIVVMAAGMAANLTFDPLDSVTTVTVQIKTLLIGDQEFDSPKTLAAFALGFVLFFLTLFFNVLALKVVKRYRERYE